MSAATEYSASRRRPLHERLCTALAATLVCAAGSFMTYAVTDGLQAFSLESARRLHALRSPATLPNVIVEFADNRRAPLIEAPGQIVLVDFIYTNCATYCRALGSIYAQLQTRLAAEIAAGAVRLLSITFDPEHDDSGALMHYRARFGGDTLGWQLARPLANDDLKRVLRAFGVVVIPDSLGGFAHNAAVHIVDQDGKLAAILDPDDLDGIVEFTRTRMIQSNDALL